MLMFIKALFVHCGDHLVRVLVIVRVKYDQLCLSLNKTIDSDDRYLITNDALSRITCGLPER